jgi:hypothetical protein
LSDRFGFCVESCTYNLLDWKEIKLK